MQALYNSAFAKHGRAKSKRREFGDCWKQYISTHPWDVEVRDIGFCRFEVVVKVRHPAPLELSLIFSEWLAALRGSLDHGLYALAAAISGKNPPPYGGRLQFPICKTPADFDKQRSRLEGLPTSVVAALEGAQPYKGEFGWKGNLSYWINELARIDRHRSLLVGGGRIDEHCIRVLAPQGTTVNFDESVKPYKFIEDELVVGRFSSDHTVEARELKVDLIGTYIAPEVSEWAEFSMGGHQTLFDRMYYSEFFTRNHLENLALMGETSPPDGFETFTPPTP